jgi:metallo-beta-lactamase class B
LKSLPCDIFFAPHGYQFGMTEKFAQMDKGSGIGPLIDPKGWAALIANNEAAFRHQLEAERAIGP